ncbi:alpha/beta fold hydrolase [Bacillus sp. RHFS10]|uniref:alpha/beta fold hydrolase n=1 Tax=Bacillus sp. RHFS10 TaxID=2804501 RepID=UPI0019269FBE|nr:alpha/beta fold hydrolase [Bacillus sp. RHFS10]MBL3649446.1 alpha/beta fold hydrolase [Bacillus sp. RHFS10]
MRFSVLVKNDDYIVTDHVLHQVHTVPGVTYLDLITRFLSAKGINTRSFEIKHVLFQEPVATSAQFDKKVTFQFTEQKNGWLVETVSRKWIDRNVADHEVSVNLQAEITSGGQQVSEKKIRPKDLKKGALRTTDAETAYSNLRKGGLIHKEFMKLEGTVYEGKDYILGEVSLSGLAKEYIDDFYLHPAFLDGSLSLLGVLASAESDALNDAFIPIYIETFRSLNKTGETCFVYIDKNNITQPSSKDILYADIQVYNSDGELSFYYERFGVKRVRNEESIQRLEYKGIKDAEDRDIKIADDSLDKSLIKQVAAMIQKPEESVKTDITFYELGLDSKQLLNLSKTLEQLLQTKLYPTLLFDYSTIGELTEYLCGKYGDKIMPPAASVTKTDLKETLSNELAFIIGDLTRTSAYEVNQYRSFYELGLDSRQLLQISKMIEEKIGASLYPTLLFDYNNIHDLASYLEEKYEMLTQTESEEDKKQSKEAPDAGHLENIYMQKEWSESPLLSEGVPKGNILILDFERSMSDDIQKHAGSKTVIYAQADSEYLKISDRHYKFHPENPEHYMRILNDVKLSGLFPETIIHFLSKETQDNRLDPDLTHSFYSVLYVSKALLSQKLTSRLKFLYMYSKDQYTNPSYAAVSGFFKTLQAEQPNIECKTIEFTTNQTIQIAPVLLDEINGDFNQTVKYENNRRFVSKYREVPSVTMHKTEATLIKNGVYLVIGGLRGIGWIFSKFIYSDIRANVVIAGRSELTPKMEEKLEKIRSRGIRITYIQADMTVKKQVTQLLEKVYSDFAKINGVFYSAGVIRDSFIMNKTNDDVHSVLQSKISGVIHLDEALADMPLDFFVLFSSISAEIGSLGQADYAYANSFLDNFAEWRECIRKTAGRQGKTISVNWPFWKNGGMSIDNEVQKIMKTHLGLHPLETFYGIEAIKRSLAQTGHQMIVLYGKKEKVITYFQPLPSSSGVVLVRDSSIAADIDASSYIPEKTGSAVQLLGTADNSDLDDYLNFWSRIKKGVPSQNHHIDAAKKLISFYQNRKMETVHFLINTANVRNMEIVMSGKGETILLICGFATTAYMWKEQIKEWANHFNVIVIHTPGYGLSKGSDDFTLSGLSSAFIEVLEDIGVTWPIHIAAASWGGMVGQRIAYEYPEKVKTLTLSGSYTTYKEDPDHSVEEKLKEDFANIGRLNEYEMLYSNQFLNASIEHFMEIHNREGYSTISFLKEIKTRTLILTGENEAVVDLEETNLLQKYLTNAVSKEIEGAGHLSNVTHPREFNKTVIDFIKN